VTKRERVYATIDGKPVDRPPVALWRHFPNEDQKADPLAQAHAAFQKAYDWDFLKITPASSFYGDDWGLKATYRPNREGTRHYTDRPVKKETDWPKLKRLDVTTGTHGRELQTIRLLRKLLPDEILLASVFSPLTIARTLAGETALLRYLRDSVDETHEGLDVIAEATAKFSEECLAAGAVDCMFKNEVKELFLARIAAMSRAVRNRKSIEAERERLAGILGSVGDGVYGVNQAGQITFINPAARRILGYDAAAPVRTRNSGAVPSLPTPA